jgi:hypothetical protein
MIFDAGCECETKPTSTPTHAPQLMVSNANLMYLQCARPQKIGPRSESHTLTIKTDSPNWR